LSPRECFLAQITREGLLLITKGVFSCTDHQRRLTAYHQGRVFLHRSPEKAYCLSPREGFLAQITTEDFLHRSAKDGQRFGVTVCLHRSPKKAVGWSELHCLPPQIWVGQSLTVCLHRSPKKAMGWSEFGESFTVFASTDHRRRLWIDRILRRA
jgi:hypothetical protein